MIIGSSIYVISVYFFMTSNLFSNFQYYIHSTEIFSHEIFYIKIIFIVITCLIIDFLFENLNELLDNKVLKFYRQLIQKSGEFCSNSILHPLIFFYLERKNLGKNPFKQPPQNSGKY